MRVSKKNAVMECSLERLKAEDKYSDWDEVFKYSSPKPIDTRAVLFDDCSNAPFRINDVVRVIASVNGTNDGPDWVMVGQLQDGRYFKIRAGCDFTGWG